MSDRALDDVVEIKVLVVGSTAAGKTSAIRAFGGHPFLHEQEYEQTGDVTPSYIQLKGNGPIVHATFWDCPPQKFLNSPHEMLLDATCVVIVYDVCNYDSYLEATKSWMDLVKPNMKPETGLFVMLLGCKTDMATRRAVSIKEAEIFASRSGVFFMEISAKKGTNVELSLALLRIRCVNSLSSGNAGESVDSMIPSAPSSVGQHLEAPPSPPPSPPASESHVPEAETKTQQEEQLVKNMMSQGIKVKSPKRQFGLTAQISSSYDTINSILGRQPSLLQQKSREPTFNASASASDSDKSLKVKSPKEQVYTNLMEGRRSQHSLGLSNSSQNANASNNGSLKLETKESANNKSSPVFEQEYEVLRGMFEDFDTSAKNVLASSKENTGFQRDKFNSDVISLPNGTSGKNRAVRVYSMKSPPKGQELDNMFARSTGPKLDSFETIDSPQVARQVTGMSSLNEPRMPKSGASPASIPLLDASKKITVVDTTFEHTASSMTSTQDDTFISSNSYGNILAKAYGQNLPSRKNSPSGAKGQSDLLRGKPNRRWNDNNVVKISPRKLKAKVVRQERNKQIPLWNQHVVKKKFGEEEVKSKRKRRLGYLPKQYQRYRRQRPSIKEKPTTPPDLVVDVTLPNGQSGEIEVRAGDNARDLAERYVYKNQLRMRFIPILTDLIEEKVKEFLVLEERKIFARKRKQAREALVGNKLAVDEVHTPDSLNNGITPSPSLTVPEPFYLETARRGRSTYKSPPKRIIAKLHIDVGPSKRGTITIRIGDDPERLVSEFRRAYRIKATQGRMILKRVQKLINDAKQQESVDRENDMSGASYSRRDSAVASYLDELGDETKSPSNLIMTSPSLDSPERALTPAQNELLRRTLGFGNSERQRSQITRDIADLYGKNVNKTSSLDGVSTALGASGGATENSGADVDIGLNFDVNNQKQIGKPVFNLDINLPGKKSKRITVYEGNDPEELAKDFVEQNGLPQSSVDRLTQLLVSGLEKHQSSLA